MLKKMGVVGALVALVAGSSLLMSCGSGHGRRSALLYVVSQSLFNLSSYSLDLASGDLTLITNDMPSTCAASPASSCGLPTSITTDPTGATAFVLSQNAISAYTVNDDGSLSQPTAAATLASGQTAQGWAVTAAGDMMFVISNGGSNPTDCNVDGGYTADCPAISVFSTTPGSTTVTPTGNACLINMVSQPTCPYSLSRVPTGVSVMTFTPSGGSAQTMLFVSSNHDLTQSHNDSELSVFSVDSSGNLTEQAASPYLAQAPNPLSVYAVNTNPPGPALGGLFVYEGSQAAVTGSVSGWEVCTVEDSNCTQADVQNGNLAIAVKPTTIGQNPITMLADPTNTFLYIACYAGSNIYAFRMNSTNGALTALSPALVPTGAGPVSLAIHPSSNNSNEFLYVSNNTGNSLIGYDLNLTTGDLGSPMAPVIFTPGNPYGIAGR